MALRNGVRLGTLLCHLPARRLPWLPGSRRFQSASSNIVLEKDKNKGVAVLKLSHGPVNSLSLDTLEEMTEAVDSLEKDPQYRGLLITSSIPGVFCSGLDISEMYQPEPARLRRYWTAVQEWWLRLYGSKLVIVSAINGHSPGGGCMMALCSDYRIMASGRFTIGLNEAQVGLVSSTWSYFMTAMVNTVGNSRAERALQLGQLFSAEEAMLAGLVDELVPQSDLLERAHQVMDKWLTIQDASRQTTKVEMRRETLGLLSRQREADVEQSVRLITGAPVQRIVAHYLARLKKT